MLDDIEIKAGREIHQQLTKLADEISSAKIRGMVTDRHLKTEIAIIKLELDKAAVRLSELI